jgi:predicted esterase
MTEEHHLRTQRWARFCTIGEPGSPVREIIYAFHGYGQLGQRFALRLQTLSAPGRLVVVPEALSRFYVTGMGIGDPRVGASWMTRENREREIADQLDYLDTLHATVVQGLNTEPELALLGFSQGTAAAARWLESERVHARTLVAWAGKLPPELTAQRMRTVLRGVRVVLAFGDSDELAPRAEVAREEERLKAGGVPYEHYTFQGGHELHDETLLRIFPTASPSAATVDVAKAL